MRLTITLHFVSSFVRRMTYPKINSIGLDLVEKNTFEFVMDGWMDRVQSTEYRVQTPSWKEDVYYSPR